MTAQKNNNNLSIDELGRVVNELKMMVLEMVQTAKAGHVAGPLSAANVIAALYLGGILDLERDKFVLSCGHYVPILYAALSKLNLIKKSELNEFMQAGSRLPGHPERGLTPGVEVSTGSLGQGISVAVGMALGYKKSHHEGIVYCMVSDGELQEGQVWEAVNLAVAFDLDNLVIIVDANKVQIEHYVAEVVKYQNWASRFESFGLEVRELNGDKLVDVMKVFNEIKSERGGGRVRLIVSHTTAGKGVDFMENDPEWHDKVPSTQELKLARAQLMSDDSWERQNV